MAHYAFLDRNNIVIEVIYGKEEGEDGINWEERYSEIRNLSCKRTSYNTRNGVHTNGGTPFRKNYAGIGFSYNAELDAFVPPKYFDSWVLDENSGFHSLFFNFPIYLFSLFKWIKFLNLEFLFKISMPFKTQLIFLIGDVGCSNTIYLIWFY